MNDRETLDNDEILTQFGTRIGRGPNDKPFRDCPRVTETDLSLLRGRMSVEDATRAVRYSLRLSIDEGVRYSTVGRLRNAGFTVTHTPTRRNSQHISVTLASQWEQEHRDAFNNCFDKPIWGKEAS